MFLSHCLHLPRPLIFVFHLPFTSVACFLPSSLLSHVIFITHLHSLFFLLAISFYISSIYSLIYVISTTLSGLLILYPPPYSRHYLSTRPPHSAPPSSTLLLFIHLFTLSLFSFLYSPHHSLIATSLSASLSASTSATSFSIASIKRLSFPLIQHSWRYRLLS